jgi:hypothetical protein
MKGSVHKPRFDTSCVADGNFYGLSNFIFTGKTACSLPQIEGVKYIMALNVKEANAECDGWLSSKGG